MSGDGEGARGSAEPALSPRRLSPQLSSETLSFSFTVERDVSVRGLKPAPVRVYDYYETGECRAGARRAAGAGTPFL